MGQRMPDVDIEYGSNCLLGFDAGETPKYLYIRFSGIIKCPDVPPIEFPIPPNDRVFKLTQLEVNACHWWFDDADWSVWFYLSPTGALVRFELRAIAPAKLIFWSETAGPLVEVTVYTNINQTCPPLRAASKGIATVTWSPQATALLAAINMTKGTDLFMELFPKDDGTLVYKFCRISESTNIKILFDPEA